MKKYLAILCAALLAAACCGTAFAAAPTEAAELPTGVYTLYNVTGEKITELYLFETGSEDQGENLTPDGLDAGRSLVVTFTGEASTVLTLAFTTESEAAAKFETLHIEEAPISLLPIAAAEETSVDAATGATPISFFMPENTGSYHVVNTTGAVVTELYLYPAGSEDKGTNLAAEGLEADAFVDVTFSGEKDSVLVLSFTTADGETKAFETLHIETATINLLSADAMTGATPIAFGF